MRFFSSFLLQVAPLGALAGRRDILHSALMVSSALNEEKEDGACPFFDHGQEITPYGSF
jgi:hypothetical protein